MNNKEKTEGELQVLENLAVHLYRELIRVRNTASNSFSDDADEELKKACLVATDLSAVIGNARAYSITSDKEN